MIERSDIGSYAALVEKTVALGLEIKLYFANHIDDPEEKQDDILAEIEQLTTGLSGTPRTIFTRKGTVPW